MTALDTNVLVRFLVKDDPQQSRKAARVVQDALAKGNAIFISDTTLVETVWVLGRSYKLLKKDIVSTIRKLLASRNLRFSSVDLVTAATRSFENGKGGFADYIIKEQSLAAGSTAVVTFDKALKSDADYVVL
jgi:predicted nucleic-acid-binding protein